MKTMEIPNKDLVEFMKFIQLYINTVDELEKNGQIDKKRLARCVNSLQYNFHSFLHFGCGVPLKDVGKTLNKTFKFTS